MKLKSLKPSQWSIRWKLTYMAMVTTTLALLLATAGEAVFEYITLRESMRGQLQMLGEVISGNCSAAIAFDRADDAQSTLQTLSANRNIRGACIYDANGKLMAKYTAEGEEHMNFAQTPPAPGMHSTAEYIDLYLPVQLDGKVIGTVYLRSDLRELYQRLEMHAVASPLIVTLVVVLSLLLVRRLQRLVSAPILSLAETSRRVSEEKNYNLRAPKFGDDELGRLGDAFNHMLEGIQKRDEQIQRHLQDVKAARDELEARVEVRTADLKSANTSLQAEIVQRQEAEKKREEMQASLVEASRKAGMADVATGVLHNVGNVLNSVNVSTQMIHDKVKASRVAGLKKAVQLLDEHAQDLPAFLTADARGKSLGPYLAMLAGALDEEHKGLLEEVNSLSSNISHIREIVAMQQSLSRVSGVHTSASLGEMIEDAIKINSAGLQRHQVVIEREFDPGTQVVVDRHKVQVLRAACRQVRRWRERFASHEVYRNLHVAVNLSEKQLTLASLVDDITGILKEEGVPPDAVVLEITETVVMARGDGAIETLRRLGEKGFQLAMDDFGTGYSSLSHLHRVPVNTIKVDRSFVRKMNAQDRQFSATVQAIVSLAHNCGFSVVGEGVETVDQLVQLQTLDCDLAQGYWFSHPVPAAAADQLLLDNLGTAKWRKQVEDLARGSVEQLSGVSGK